MNQKIVDEAKTWLGTPYHGGAKLKGIGVDCGQFLIGVVEGAGLIKRGEIDPGHYSQDWPLHRSGEMYLSWIEKYCDRVSGEPQPGDFLLYRYGRCISHASIVINFPVVIHSYINQGVIISNENDGIFKMKNGTDRLFGIYRFREVK